MLTAFAKSLAILPALAIPQRVAIALRCKGLSMLIKVISCDVNTFLLCFKGFLQVISLDMKTSSPFETGFLSLLLLLLSLSSV